MGRGRQPLRAHSLTGPVAHPTTLSTCLPPSHMPGAPPAHNTQARAALTPGGGPGTCGAGGAHCPAAQPAAPPARPASHAQPAGAAPSAGPPAVQVRQGSQRVHVSAVWAGMTKWAGWQQVQRTLACASCSHPQVLQAGNAASYRCSCQQPWPRKKQLLKLSAHQEALQLNGGLEGGTRPLLRLRLALQNGLQCTAMAAVSV